MSVLLLVVVFAVVAAAAVSSRSRRRAQRERARTVAARLLPEVRAILRSSEPDASSGGEPAPAAAYESLRSSLDGVLPEDARFALDGFYGSVESYRHARSSMERAFDEEGSGDVVSLGDRIRAKDQRDRLLKDVYDSGAFAIEKLERIAETNG